MRANTLSKTPPQGRRPSSLLFPPGSCTLLSACSQCGSFYRGKVALRSVPIRRAKGHVGPVSHAARNAPRSHSQLGVLCWALSSLGSGESLLSEEETNCELASGVLLWETLGRATFLLIGLTQRSLLGEGSHYMSPKREPFTRERAAVIEWYMQYSWLAWPGSLR